MIICCLLGVLLLGLASGTGCGEEPGGPRPRRMGATLVEQHRFAGEASAQQGLALAEDSYYSSNATSICRFDTEWNLLETKTITVKGVNHLGAIDYHAGYIWAGFLHGPEGDQYDPNLDRSVIAKIRASDLEVVQTWDITDDVTWIDPVCFDGKYVWVGDNSDLGIHRYRFTNDGGLIRDGVFRYPGEMHFSQGVRVVGRKLYSIHTFGSMDGLFQFEIPDTLSDAVNFPVRVWDIQEMQGHLEGFDFVPGHPNQIWHAQFSQVDRYILDGLPERNTASHWEPPPLRQAFGLPSPGF